VNPQKIHFLLNERVHPVPNPIFARAMALLEQRGFTISSGIPEEALLCPDRLGARHHLYVLKSQTELALSVAGVLHDRGGRFLNPYPACALAQNKITAASRLAASGVPVPRCWLTADFARLCELAAERPIVVKPYRGHRGAGVVVAHAPDDLVGIELGDQPMLVQEFIPGKGGDLKVYVVGQNVFGVRKDFSAESFRATGTLVAVTPAVRAIALRCGAAFGIGLYGIDIIESPDGPVVVDFNHSPGFRGVPDAAPLIAQHVENVVRGRTRLPAVPPALKAQAAWGGFLQEIPA
jgi:ribosomal protein S6--L-glutamate ligase